MDEALSGVNDFRLSEDIVAPLRQRLPDVAVQTIAAITATVPAYAEAFAGELGAKIERAVRAALGAFLHLVSRSAPDPGAPLGPAIEAAYALGRGEARSGRSLDALLAAYRVGARVAWRELAAISVATGQPAHTIARFAELVFAYIDELSAASVAGHADELASSGRARRRQLELLAQALATGEPADVVIAAAERAEWAPPQSLTAVLVPGHAVRPVADLLDPRTLEVAEAAPDLPETSVLLVPDAHGPSRAHLLRVLAGRGAVVGPARPWLRTRESVTRAIRVDRLGAGGTGPAAVDTEEHLLALVVTADPPALADLRERALAPLAEERDATAAKLVETLRSWLLHQGRREDVAAELFVHPQTVRYRMSRLRELYGDRLKDPQWLLLLTVALAVPSGE
ncbi:helix-turn-helix domain-containing protein [Pseudosporangium ferrugineum]|uniref:PucR-like helix-turn-helix protein n=1 Tax=Pseudosporangium ferrugineum TaxID=439699 RepID=A0A2T0RX43_9ACTN|nr:PucR family transcriptional regulator [Pseudosporangium ferrugineum]PRY25717.1 PucR-like helix-turn-helix protein [Pseudosporangium ferrugineum]